MRTASKTLSLCWDSFQTTGLASLDAVNDVQSTHPRSTKTNTASKVPRSEGWGSSKKRARPVFLGVDVGHLVSLLLLNCLSLVTF